MPRIPLHPASGTGIIDWGKRMTIRFVRYGCTNRPFYHIVVIENSKVQRGVPIEQVGTYDDCVNAYSEKIVSFNFERIMYWIGHGASMSRPVAQLLGIGGFLPIHPRTYIAAWRNRRYADQKAAAAAEAAAAEAAAAETAATEGTSESTATSTT